MTRRPSSPRHGARRGAPAATLALGAVALLAPHAARAQGSLSGQGFGYPPGQLSTRALSMGGGLAEFDPVSPINPAAINGFGRTAFAFQYDPEFRTTTAGSATVHNTIARFPVVAAGVPIRGGRFTLGLSASTFLDRSFTTNYQTTTDIGRESVLANETVESRGSIADIRLAAGAVVTRWLRVGVGVHRLAGENRLVSGRQFADTSRFGPVNDSTTISYGGSAISAGAELTPVRGFSVAGSARRGGRLHTSRNDSTLTSSDSPDRYGIGVRVDRITGATIAASYARTTWSRMRGLGSPTLDARDTDELMGGIEAVGPSVGSAPLILRLGARRRTLPFALAGAQIRETSFGGGLGLPLAGGRALADVGLQRMLRTPESGGSALAGARERAYTLSVGFTIRP